jgi:LPS-assembly lipoprotein
MRISALLPAGLVSGLALALASCGFHPMYSQSANGGPAIGPVVIDRIDGKGGYVLKSELEKLLDVERGTGPVRHLVITMTEAIGGLGFRVDESASRSDLYLDASYQLYDFEGRELLRGAMRSVASYDVPNSAYGEITAQDDARERAAETLAEKLRADIAIRLAQQRAKGDQTPATKVEPTNATPQSVTPAPVTPILETPKN